MGNRGQDVVGRDEERGLLAGWLDDVDGLPRAVLLEGEAGIGKSTLWRWGLARAIDHGYHVLSCSPAESEVPLGFSGLRDLLDHHFDLVAPELAPPQRVALAAALLRDDHADEPVETSAVATAFLSLVRVMARTGPVVVAVDDLQWLDASSSLVLWFVLRRLRDEPVALLAGVRRERGEGAPIELDRRLAEDRLHHLWIDPLGFSAIHRLLRHRLGQSFPRPVVRRLHKVSGGNPLFALELGRGLARRPTPLAPGEPLPVPKSVMDLVKERLDRFPQPIGDALLFAALASNPTVSALSAVLGEDLDLTPVLSEQFIEVEAVSGAIRFSHPLFATAVRARADLSRRRDVHRRLAAHASDPEERAMHLALGTDGPDHDVVDVVHGAARGAVRRGAPAVAAELLEHARRLTNPASSAFARLTIDAADAHYKAGDPARAVSLLETLVAQLEAGRDRAEARWLLGAIEDELSGWRVATRLWTEALLEATGDPALQARLYRSLAETGVYAGDPDGAARHADAAVRLAEQVEDPRLLADALAAQIHVALCAGRAPAAAGLQRALALERSYGTASIEESPTAMYAADRRYAFDLEEARQQYDILLARAVESGDETNESYPLIYLVLTDLFSGQWGAAARHLTRLREICEQTGVNVVPMLHVQALLEAHHGHVDEARDAAERVLEASTTADEPLQHLLGLQALGFLELSLGRWDEASRVLGVAEEVADGGGFAHPYQRRFMIDRAESLIAAGDLTTAEQTLRRFESTATTDDYPWASVLAARARGLLQAAQGDLPGALVTLEKAMEAHDCFPVPFERARTLLALGATRRRARQQRKARDALQEALIILDGLGARLWAERARAEMARVGGRTPASGELTPTERTVAELVAGGRSNKEVAAALFVTVKTVERNLSRIFDKLGVRSRTELSRRLDRD